MRRQNYFKQNNSKVFSTMVKQGIGISSSSKDRYVFWFQKPELKSRKKIVSVGIFS
jgi:hypothetical protein